MVAKYCDSLRQSRGMLVDEVGAEMVELEGHLVEGSGDDELVLSLG